MDIVATDLPEPMPIYIVTMTSSPCDAYPETKCVMNVIGPILNASDFAEIWNSLPEWMSPHKMRLTSVDDWLQRQ